MILDDSPMHASDLEARLLELARSRGHLSPEPAGGGEAVPEDLESTVWGDRVQWHIERGDLDPLLVRDLMREVLHTEGTPLDLPLTLPEEAGPLAPEAGAAPRHDWNRYSRVEAVGSGGEGRVYKAWDNLLDRWVALKFPRWDAVQRGRLQEEARALARVQHPAVRTLHDLGILEGQPFLAMRWVEGGSLQKLKDTLDRRTRVRLLAEVCEGIAAVHREGLLHLDLKPANVLLERGPEGEWKALVADFGLGLRPGEGRRHRGLGTLPFASPEQLRPGGDLDARSDVYSLGVMLFMLLTDRAPSEDAKSPVREVPRDLLLIAQKAMAGAPAARYASAAGLGTELRRYLAHEPLSVRRPTPLYLGRLLVRRRPAAALVALMVAGVLGGLAFRAWQDRQRAAMASRFGQELQEVVSLVNLSNMAPLHDHRPEVARTRARMTDLAAHIRSLGPSAEGPGHLALGQAHLLLDEYDPALEAFEKAEKAGLRSLELDEWLGTLRAIRYFREADLPSERLHIRWKDPSLAALRRVAAARPEDVPAGVLLALLEDRTEAAYRLGERALAPQPEPWRHWNLKLLCEIWDGQVQRHIAQKEYALARRTLEIYERTLDRALDIARSDPALYESKGILGFGKAYLAEVLGRSPEAAFQESLEAFRLLDRIHPDDKGLRLQAEAYRRIGVWRASHGRDPEPAWSKAEALLKVYGQRTLPWARWGLQTAARIHLARAHRALDQGRDPRPELQRCEPWLDRLAARPDSAAYTQQLRFNARALAALAALRRGGRAEEELAAILAFLRAEARAARPLPSGAEELDAFGPVLARMNAAERTLLGELRATLRLPPHAKEPDAP